MREFFIQRQATPARNRSSVFSNPAQRPYQAYSWFVAQDLKVSSFADMLDGRIESNRESPNYPVGRFEGVMAPEFRLKLSGTRTWIATSQEALAL